MRERPDTWLVRPASGITDHASRFTPHVSRLTFHASRFTHHQKITLYIPPDHGNVWPEKNLSVMQKPASFLGAVLLVGMLASGCAGPEKKFGRGMNNVFE